VDAYRLAGYVPSTDSETTTQPASDSNTGSRLPNGSYLNIIRTKGRSHAVVLVRPGSSDEILAEGLSYREAEQEAESLSLAYYVEDAEIDEDGAEEHEEELSPSSEQLIPERDLFWWYFGTFLTLGLLGIVWITLINSDAKGLAAHYEDVWPQARSWSPALSLFSLLVGVILIVPTLVTLWRTWSRVRLATASDDIAAGRQFVFCFVPILNLGYYGILQSRLNRAAFS
jgi:hypothetical protein